MRDNPKAEGLERIFSPSASGDVPELKVRRIVEIRRDAGLTFEVTTSTGQTVLVSVPPRQVLRAIAHLMWMYPPKA